MTQEGRKETNSSSSSSSLLPQVLSTQLELRKEGDEQPHVRSQQFSTPTICHFLYKSSNLLMLIKSKQTSGDKLVKSFTQINQTNFSKEKEQTNCNRTNNALIEYHEIKVAFGNADVYLLQTLN